ncbi:MAG: hypothetical protein BWY57_02290 [Betaproteobacteria bacterium ADurb.Bin341]|nr:MAG: hypothetical protein BWY57_02290 [Betaproteobacteria bacterium ADurb.Bin341]
MGFRFFYVNRYVLKNMSNELTPSNWQASILAACTMKEDRNHLSCSRAIELGQALGVPLPEIGQFCQSQGIKIVDCALGCFGSGRKGG